MDLNKFFFDLDGILSKGMGQEAIQFIQDAMDEAIKQDDKKALVAIYNEAGSLCRDFSKYEDAEKYYKEALAIIEQLEANGSESHGTTLINYGTSLGNSGRYDEAIDVYSEAAAILSSLEINNDYRMAALYNNMSLIAQEKGNLEDAEDYLNKALFLLKRVADSEGEEAASYTNLANLYWAQGKLEESKVMLIKAVDIYKDNEGLKREGRYAAAISALANIFFSEEEYEKSATLYKEAMNEIEKEFGQNDAWQIVAANLADVEEKLKNTN